MEDDKNFLIDINNIVKEDSAEVNNNIKFDPLGEDDNDRIWERMKLLRLKSSVNNDKKVSFAASNEIKTDNNIDIDKMILDQNNLWKSFKNNKNSDLFLP